MVAEIAIVMSPRDWAERLHRFVADHGGARVRARILDGREATAERYQVLVAEDLTSFLTPRLVDEVHRSGRRILGVYEPTEPWGRERLIELGVDETVPATAEPEELVRLVDGLAITATVDLDRELQRLTAPVPGGGEPRRRAREGTVVAVGGPAGGPGATEVALALAIASAQPRRTALVDADDVAPSLAQRLGLPLHPNLRTAIDVVEHRTGELADALTPVAGPAVDVVCGLPHGRHWSRVRPGEVVDVIRAVARHRHLVVANVGHRIEDIPGESGGRHGIARAVLATADLVVGVGAPSPVGLTRLLDWIADVRALTRAPLHVAVNRAPGSRFLRGEIEDELRRTFSPLTLAFLPEDRRVEEAGWAGRPVRRGPFVRSIERFADDLFPAPSATGAAGPSPAATPTRQAAAP